MSTEHSGRKSYETPRLERFGTVGELTLVGMTNPGTDTMNGSVNPPGGGPPSGVGGGRP